MVKGLSSEVAITLVNAVRRRSSKAGQTLRDEVTRKLGRIVMLFRRPHNQVCGAEEIERHAKIEMLPDEILLEIFDCVRLAVRAATEPDCNICDDSDPSCTSCEWQLVHVCRRWRSLVFASPHRLDLRLVYSFRRKARVMKKALDRWPTLPIVLWYPQNTIRRGPFILEDESNAYFALQHPNRIREINLFLTNSLLLKTGGLLFSSFPVLEYLRLESPNATESPPTLPVGFLGGSTPRLRHIHFTGIDFPTLPLLLSSTRNLVSLRLDSVSRSGYFSPETLSNSLSMMTQLKSLMILFLPFSIESGSAARPLTVRAILPELNKFHFSGDRAYLKGFFSMIEFPILERVFNLSVFGTRQLSQFTSHPISHLLAPQSIMLWEDRIFFVNQVRTSPIISHYILNITSEEIDSKTILPHIFTRHSVLLYGTQRLDMRSFLQRSHRLDPDEIDSALWVDFFHQLENVTMLVVAGMFVQITESVLKQIPEDKVRRVLPALKDLYVGMSKTPDGPFEKFASARRCSGRPITMHYVAFQPRPNY